MTTTWTVRVEVSTTWSKRKKPSLFIAPLQDAYRKVHDENDEVIYIISSTGKEVPSTRWTARKSI